LTLFSLHESWEVRGNLYGNLVGGLAGGLAGLVGLVGSLVSIPRVKLSSFPWGTALRLRQARNSGQTLRREHLCCHWIRLEKLLSRADPASRDPFPNRLHPLFQWENRGIR